MIHSLPFLLALLIGPFSWAEHASVIYGDDDRKDLYQVDAMTSRLADATAVHVLPHELSISGDIATLNTIPFGVSLALCSSEPFYSQPTIGHCSGFLIAPNLLLTAGHCMSTESTCQSARYVFGFAMKSEAVPASWKIPTSEIYSCKRIVHTVSGDSEDFAVVELDRMVAHHDPLPYRETGFPQRGEPLLSIGYPEGLPVKIANGAHIRDVNEIFLTANLDTYGGNSGSAIVSAATGVVEGILVRGDNDFVTQNGCYVSNRCPDTGCRGEDATLMSRVLPYLKQ